MKSIIVLSAIVTIISALKQEPYKVSPEKLRVIIDKYAKPCVPNENVDVDILVAKIGDASLPRDDATNEFLYCFAFKAGYVQEDGHIVVDGVAGISGNHPLKEEMKASLRKCNEITKENPVLTTVAMNNCIAENAPIRYIFNS